MKSGIENCSNSKANLQNQPQNLLLGQTECSKRQIFYLEDENTRNSQLFTFCYEFLKNNQQLVFNLYELFIKIESPQTKCFNVFNSKQCKFQIIENIVFDYQAKNCQVNDHDFWRIVKDSFGLITIKYTDDWSAGLSAASPISIKNQTEPIITESNQKQKAVKNIQVKKISKGGRSSERTIGEAISLVKKWREDRKLNKLEKCFGKKKSFVDSAMNVGISKKSLDDYYYQLRNGEKFGFDFLLHLNKKVGFLRSFLRNKIPKKQPGKKNQKHGKELRIIQLQISPQTSSVSFNQNYESMTHIKSELAECYEYQESELKLLNFDNQSYAIQSICSPFDNFQEKDSFGFF